MAGYDAQDVAWSRLENNCRFLTSDALGHSAVRRRGLPSAKPGSRMSFQDRGDASVSPSSSDDDDDDDDPILTRIRQQIQDDDVKYGKPPGVDASVRQQQTTATVVRHVRDAGPRGMPAPTYRPRLVVARRAGVDADGGAGTSPGPSQLEVNNLDPVRVDTHAATHRGATQARVGRTSAAIRIARAGAAGTSTKPATDATDLETRSHVESSAALAELEAILADDAAFRPSRSTSAAPADASSKDLEETMRRVDRAAYEAERTRGELRARVSGIMAKVDDVTASSASLREIESMAKELHERTSDFGKELVEVARINDVRLDDD